MIRAMPRQYRMEPIERAVEKLRGGPPDFPKRDDGAGWDHEAGKMIRFLESKHLTPEGCRYRRLIRLRSRNRGHW